MINTIIVDDSSLCVNMLNDICATYEELSIHKFTTPTKALEYARTASLQLAFLDVDMPELNGIELGRLLRHINPEVILIYVSSKEAPCPAAMRMKADGYIFKPYSVADISYAIEKSLVLLAGRHDEIFIQATPFEVFCNHQLVHFSNRKSKELLSLCVDAGGSELSMEWIISKLWPERPIDEKTKRLYRKAIISLKETLHIYTEKKIFHNYRGFCCILMDTFTTDKH